MARLSRTKSRETSMKRRGRERWPIKFRSSEGFNLVRGNTRERLLMSRGTKTR